MEIPPARSPSERTIDPRSIGPPNKTAVGSAIGCGVDHTSFDFKPSRVDSFGSARWVIDTYLPLRNIQVNASKSASAPDFGCIGLIARDKRCSDEESRLVILVHELAIIDAWKIKRQRSVEALGDQPAMSELQLHCLREYELVVSRTLEICLFESLSEEELGVHSLDLLDYCQRKILRLSKLQCELSVGQKQLNHIPSGQAEIAQYIASHDMVARLTNDLNICFSAIHILRYLVEHRSAFPISVGANLFRHHDTLVQVISLIENEPWVRRNSSTGLSEKWHDGEWKQYTNELSTVEGSCWIVILSLICSEEVRSGCYHLTSFRSNSLLKLRRYLTENVLIQIPQLEILKRFLEELNVNASLGSGNSLTRVHSKSEQGTSSLSPFAIVEVEERLLQKYVGDENLCLFPDPLTHEEMVQIGSILSAQFEELIPEDAKRMAPVCCICSKPGDHRCSACKAVIYCGRDCQMKDWNSHKTTCRNL